MGKTKEDFLFIFDKLNNSKTEEDIVSLLIKVLKGFDISIYREYITSNPYYKSLLVDVVEIVLLDIREMKKLISSEISKISEDIKITKSEDIEKLTLLKSECQNLLLEITDRELEICDLIT